MLFSLQKFQKANGLVLPLFGFFIPAHLVQGPNVLIGGVLESRIFICQGLVIIGVSERSEMSLCVKSLLWPKFLGQG